MVMLLEKTDFDKSPPSEAIVSSAKQVRLLVCGDREWMDYQAILNAIKTIMPSIVIEGEARGADSLAREAAESLGIPVIKFPANWNKFGKSAGPIRNIQMLKEGQPDLVLAFHDDLVNSKGTKHMVTIAEKAGIPVRVCTHKENRRIAENE